MFFLCYVCHYLAGSELLELLAGRIRACAGARLPAARHGAALCAALRLAAASMRAHAPPGRHALAWPNPMCATQTDWPNHQLCRYRVTAYPDWPVERVKQALFKVRPGSLSARLPFLLSLLACFGAGCRPLRQLRVADRRLASKPFSPATPLLLLRCRAASRGPTSRSTSATRPASRQARG